MFDRMISMDEPAIKILITGGTIDDIDYDQEENAPLNHSSFINDLLKQSRVTFSYETEILMQKDSRFITDDDRQFILEKCQNSKENKIIITHGSFTMAKTAKFLGKATLPKTIVLFGSIVPVNKEKSDALFNLGSAFMTVQLLPHGVYIVSNGKVFNWNNVRKNSSTAYFEEES